MVAFCSTNHRGAHKALKLSASRRLRPDIIYFLGTVTAAKK